MRGIMLKTIFFDFDGTVVDCQEFQISRLKNVFKHFGVDTNGVDFLKLIGPPLYNTFSKFMGKQKAQEVLSFYNSSFNPNNISGIKLFDGIKQMLTDLKNDGHTLCLTSLQFDTVVNAELNYLGITKLFDKVYCDSPDIAYKTKIELVADVIDYGGYKKEDIVLVGDTDNDIAAGIKNNLFTVAVNWGYGDVKEDDVDAVISTPKQLVSLVNQLEKQSTLK